MCWMSQHLQENVDASFVACGAEDWVFRLPFWALTHLTINDAQKWPGLFAILNDVGLQQLRVLDIFCFL